MGGDPDCDHRSGRGGSGAPGKQTPGAMNDLSPLRGGDPHNCPHCGAVREDRQIGLERSPREYVATMVGLFRELRRVLAPHGTAWLNLGDSYAGSGKGGNPDDSPWSGFVGGPEREETAKASPPIIPDGLKAKDLMMVPHRVAIALQEDGWWVRMDNVWAKKNCMPSSVLDRPTLSHEYVFLLTRSERYYYDAEAVREPHTSTRWGGRYYDPNVDGKYTDPSVANSAAASKERRGRDYDHYPNGGRNMRSVWSLATKPYAGAHFAVFPESIPRIAIEAGCPKRVCLTCGKPSVRMIEATGETNGRERTDIGDWIPDKGGNASGIRSLSGATYRPQRAATGEWSDCGHDDWRSGRVLDPFAGSGTALSVAHQLGRDSVGIELNPSFAELAVRRFGAETRLLKEDLVDAPDGTMNLFAVES